MKPRIHLRPTLALLALLAPLAATAALTTADIDFIVEDTSLSPELSVLYTDGTRQLLFPEADSHWDNGTNYGSQAGFSLKQGDKRAALIRFNLAPINKTVASAELAFFVESAAVANQPLYIHAVSGDTWDENGVHRYNQPATGVQIASVAAANRVWRTVAVTSQVSAAAADDDLVTFKIATAGDGGIVVIPARESVYADYNFGDLSQPGGNSNVSPNFFNPYVLFAHALAVHDNPNATTTSGVLVRARLVQMLRHVMLPGNEPNAAGRLLWSHNAIAQTVALVRHTPAVWNDTLSSSERARLGVFMKAMAYAGNWCYENDNNFRGFITLTGENQSKTWNPNHVEPYVGALAAASFFFGGTTLDAHFASFDYPTFINEVRAHSLHNVDWAWSQTTAAYTQYTGSLIILGTSIDGVDRGSGYGINAPFAYHFDSSVGVTAGAGDPYKIFYNLASQMYLHPASDTVGSAGYLATTPPDANPYAGQAGMLNEFDARDAFGVRTDGSYVMDGWMNNITTACAVIARGAWGAGVPASDVSAMNRRMVVGSEDFRRKMTYGWNGRKNGQPTYTDAIILDPSYSLIMRLWDSYVKPVVDTGSVPPPSAGGTTYQAENATLSAGTSQHGGASSDGGYADLGGAGTYVEFTGIAGTGAAATVVIHYANGSTASGDNRPCSISVNGGAAIALDFPQTGGWSTWGTVTANVTLANHSTNTLRVTVATSAGGPNIDKIVVTNASADINLAAAHGTITAYSGQQSGHEAVKLIDGVEGDDNNRWSHSGFPAVAEIDLGATRTINSVVLDTYQNRNYRFTIDARLSASDAWQTIVDATDETSGGPITRAISGGSPARHVRLTVTGSASYTGAWSTIRELKLMGPAATTAAAAATHQAESATLSSTTQQTGGGSDGGYADMGGLGSWIEWTGVAGDGTGASLVFHYANGSSTSGDNRTCTLTVNGVAQGDIDFPPTGGWSTWGTVTANVTLANHSTNTIRITVKGSGGPNVDKVVVTP
jgi:hypothetical protein